MLVLIIYWQQNLHIQHSNYQLNNFPQCFSTVWVLCKVSTSEVHHLDHKCLVYTSLLFTQNSVTMPLTSLSIITLSESSLTLDLITRGRHKPASFRKLFWAFHYIHFKLKFSTRYQPTGHLLICWYRIEVLCNVLFRLSIVLFTNLGRGKSRFVKDESYCGLAVKCLTIYRNTSVQICILICL